jgi:hypothetical protein
MVENDRNDVGMIENLTNRWSQTAGLRDDQI